MLRNEENIDKAYNLYAVTLVLNSNLYRLILKHSLGMRLKNNVTRWFNEMNTLTVNERVNYIFNNKYEEGFFRIWFSISNIFVFLRSRFYEKSQFLIEREEKNQKLKDRVLFIITFEEQYNSRTFYFKYIFLKNILARIGFFVSRLFLYANLFFAIIFRAWTKGICLLMSFWILYKALYRFHIRLCLKKAMIITICILIILSFIK